MSHDESKPNMGTHLAKRLVEVGCTTFFGIPGDFNLLLLDQVLCCLRVKASLSRFETVNVYLPNLVLRSCGSAVTRKLPG